jgi:nitrate reductase alpha subunit
VIEHVRQLAAAEAVRVTLHARREMDKDRVSTDDVLRILAGPLGEIIEDYPGDPRGHSHLVLGWLTTHEPLHICCAVHEDTLVIITVYRPDPAVWQRDWRTRR